MANTTPQEIAIQCRIPRLRATTLPASCRVGRTAKTVGASTKAKNIRPPIQTTSDSNIRYLTKDILTSMGTNNCKWAGERACSGLQTNKKGARDWLPFSFNPKPRYSAAEHRAAVDIQDFAGNVACPIGA